MGGGAWPFRRVVGYADGGNTSVGVPAVVLARRGKPWISEGARRDGIKSVKAAG